MKQDKGARKGLVKRKLIVAAVASACAASGAMAFEIETDSGWRGSLNTTVTASAGWRIESPDKTLVSPADAVAAGLVSPGPIAGNNPATAYASGAAQAAAYASGYRGGSNTDAGDINYKNGDRYTTLLKFVSDFEMKKGDMGGLIRVKGWYDQVKNDENSRFGHENTGYAGMIGSATATTAAKRRPLSDDSFSGLNKFDGLYLLDAYVYSGFDLGEMPGQVRVGRQAINWGESLFVQGVNQTAPLDISALRTPGAEIKEAMLPVWAVTANLGLGDGMSLDAFYQLKWEPTVLDSCGTSIWSTAEGKIGTSKRGSSRCDMLTSFGGNNANIYNNTSALSTVYGLINAPAYGGGNTLFTKYGGSGTFPYVGHGGNEGKSGKPGDSGQFGLSFRFPVDAIDTEFGLYYTNINSRTPTVSLVNATAAGINTAANIQEAVAVAVAVTPALAPLASTVPFIQAAANLPGATTGTIFSAALAGGFGGALAGFDTANNRQAATAASMAAGGATATVITGALMAQQGMAAGAAATLATNAVTVARAYAGPAASAAAAVYLGIGGTDPGNGAVAGTALLSGTSATLNSAKVLIGGNTMNGFWAYQKNIQTVAITAATNIWGVSWGAELSHQRDVPVQINGNDLVVAGLGYAALRTANLGLGVGNAGNVAIIRAMANAGTAGLGPMGRRVAAAGDGGYIRGYDLFDKTQLQVNGVYSLPQMWGATGGLLVGEVAAQWNNVPDTKNGTNVRYGRGFIYGQGASPLWGGALAGLTGPYATCAAGATAAQAGAAQVNPDGCKDDGYVTDFAWGYRVRASLDFPQIFDTSWTFTPSIFFGHDVEGYSMDFQFNEGRQTLGLGMKFDLNKTHKLEIGYTTYSNRANYDNLKDRDNATVAYSYTF